MKSSILGTQSCLKNLEPNVLKENKVWSGNLFAAQGRLVKGRKPPHVGNRTACTRLAQSSKSDTGNARGEGLKMLIELNIILHYIIGTRYH